ncbi:MAG: pitrilysin family protein [Bacteroidota bacterium]
MKTPRLRFIAIAFVLVVAAQCGLAGTEAFTVNGLKVIVKSNPANDIISAQLYLRGGSINLSEATQGIEDFVFSAAEKGSRKYPKEALNAILDRTAASIGTNATRDYTMIGLRCLRGDFNQLWEVFADVVMRPTFVPADVEVVRQNLLLGIKQRKDNPDAYLNDLAMESFYKGHPYHLEPAGVESSIAAITIAQMERYLADNLVTSKLLLVVVGNVSRDDVQKKVEATFGTLPKGEYVPVLPPPVVHDGGTVRVVERAMPTNYIVGLFSGPAPRDPDYYSMTVGMNILGWRIWEEVRTKRNLSYAPRAAFSNQFANFGLLYVTAVQPDTTVKVMLAEAKKITQEPVSAKDMKDRVTLFLTQYYLRNETNAAQAQFLAFNELSGLGWEEGDRFIENVRKVTAADVQRVAAKYIRNIQFVVLGNPKLIDEKAFAAK